MIFVHEVFDKILEISKSLLEVAIKLFQELNQWGVAKNLNNPGELVKIFWVWALFFCLKNMAVLLYLIKLKNTLFEYRLNDLPHGILGLRV
jgi:hypothetical protein